MKANIPLYSNEIRLFYDILIFYFLQFIRPVKMTHLKDILVNLYELVIMVQQQLLFCQTLYSASVALQV